MKMKSELIAVAAALTIVLPTGAAASRSSASQGGSPTVKFGLVFHDVQVDLGKKGPSVGDTQILADSLLDAKGKKVGHDAGACTFTSLAPPEAACQITFFLPSGQIATQFLNTPPPHKVAAIVGGTGAYRAARGQAIIVENRNQTGTIMFQLTR